MFFVHFVAITYSQSFACIGFQYKREKSVFLFVWLINKITVKTQNINKEHSLNMFQEHYQLHY